PPPQPQAQQGFGAPPAAAAPEKKKSKTGLFIGIGCVLAVILGCLGTGGYLWWKANQAVDEFESDLNEAVQNANEAANEAANTGGGDTAGGGGSCSRIAACCRAYVSAMGASVPASTCDAYNNVAGMQDSMCDQTMAGYRTGLQAMGRDVPSECN
ncbi:MAG: hypothetical protein H6719_09540, partial [Sandaracinaceae bacterium]|nr:hypothetical protein [Sandaracinaceae bacterium]